MKGGRVVAISAWASIFLAGLLFNAGNRTISDSLPDGAIIKAIAKVHSVETEYYSRAGVFGTLNQLRLPTVVAGGRYSIRLLPTAQGYTVSAVPIGSGRPESHTYYSDQTMAIHQHSGPGPATVANPLIGAKPQ